MAIKFEDESSVKGRIVFDDAEPQPSPYAEIISKGQANAKLPNETDAEYVARISPELVNRPISQSEIEWKTFVPTGFGPSMPIAVARPLVENFPRVAAPLGVAMSTTGIGVVPGLALTGAAGLAGEALSQAIEQETGTREGYSLPQIAVGGALSAIPAAPLRGVASPLMRGAIRVGEGAAIGGSAPLLEAGLEGRLPNADDFARAGIGALAGAALGVPFGAAELASRGAPQIPKSTQILQDATKPKPLANIASEAAAQTQGNPYAVQQSINEMLNIPPQTPMVPSTAREAAEAMEPLLARRDSATEAFTKQAELETQFNLARAEEALQEAQAARLSQPETVELTSSPANQRLQMLDTVEGNAARERARLTEIVEAENPALPQIDDLPALSPQAQRMYDEYGRVAPPLLAPVAGAGAGGVVGGVMTERQEGESEGEYRARQLRNVLLGAAGGATLGAAPIVGRNILNRGSQSPGISNAVGKNLGIINDFKPIADDISNARLRIQRGVNVAMRGTKMRKPFVEAQRKAEASIDAATDEAKIILSDARGKINALTKSGPERQALEANLNEVFSDISKIDMLPDELKPVAERIHKIRADNATKIAALEGITDATRNTILENGGDYLARNYAIFRNKNPMEARAYRNAIPKEDIEAALDAIQETWSTGEKQISRTEAQGLLNEFLDRDNFLGFTLGRKQIGGKDVTSLYQKKNIDPRLRKVLGEIEDPLDNAYHSIENQVNLIERDKQQREFIDIGEQMGIFTRNPDVAAERGMVPFIQSASEQNSPYDNWAGVFVNPVFRDEFAGSVQKAGDTNRAIDSVLGTIKAATAAFKWLKLIPSPDSRSVNLIGAWWNNAVNGRGVNPLNSESVDGIQSILIANGLMKPDGSANSRAILDLRKTLVKHRVIDESTLGKDFADTFSKSSLSNIVGKLDQFAQREIDNPGIRKAYMGARFLASGKEFAAADDVMRVVGFLQEKEQYRRAFPNMSEEDLNNVAGRIMNQTGMTYSEVPKIIRDLSQVGIIEPFVSFPYSVYRSTANSAMLGAAELRDGLATGNQELVKIGTKRLSALAAGTAAASGYGISKMINREHGVSEEQEEAAKTFAPEYVKDSPLAFDAPIKNGKVEFIQMNYLLPTGLVTSAIEDGIKAAREDGVAAGLGATTQSVVGQFSSFGEEGNPFGPAVTTIGKAMGLINKDDFGRQIYNPQDPNKWDRVAESIGRDWAPGFASKLERLYYANNPEEAAAKKPGRVFSNKEELLRFFGRRATTLDIPRLIPSKARSLYEDYLDANKLYSQEVSRERIAGDEAATQAAFASAEAVVSERFNDMVKMVNDARTLDVSDEIIRAGLIQGGLPKKVAAQVMDAVYVAPSKERADMLIDARNQRRENYLQMSQTESQPQSRSQAEVIYDQLMAAPESQRAQLWNQLSASGQVNANMVRELEAIHQSRQRR